MGLLGRYIDSLTAEEKDKIIVGQKWCQNTLTTTNGSHCLMGHVDAQHYPMRRGDALYGVRLGVKFDRTVDRFGMGRTVRACKLRAGKPQPVLREAPQQSILQSHNTPAEV